VGDSLKELRGKIDDLDREIVRLINERARIVQEIGRDKGSGNAAGEGAVYRPDRERAVYEKGLAASAGPLPEEGVRAIYREIMSACIALQRETVVAYLGPPGTFTNMAARRKFGTSVRYVPTGSIREVFGEVARGRAECGVVPVENSTEGGVNQTLDLFVETHLRVCSEIYLPVHHHLMARCRPEEIRVVYSHPQALGQCRGWLAREHPGARQVEAVSTTEAAERAVREPGAAAIASEMAADLYDLSILHRGIEDNPANVTRFFVIARNSAARTGRDKTSLMFSIKDEVGGLYKSLVPFRDGGVNLTRIESRPARDRAWEYCFFVDLEGHAEDEPVRRVLAELEHHCRVLEVLGSYPAAERSSRPGGKSAPAGSPACSPAGPAEETGGKRRSGRGKRGKRGKRGGKT